MNAEPGGCGGEEEEEEEEEEEVSEPYASYRWANGDNYDGFWRDGKMHGFGRLRWANGDSYEGNWVEGRMEGKGKKTKLEAGVVEEGDYIDGVARGTVVRLLLKSGDKFVGNDVDGYGENTWATEHYMYCGMWFDGKMHGAGRFFPAFERNPSTDRSIVANLRQSQHRNQRYERTYDDPGWVKSYSGNYREGKRHGFGVSTLCDGSEYSGEWKADLFDGYGRLTYSSESTYRCNVVCHPHNYFTEFNHESLQELKRYSCVNIVMCGNFSSGRVNGRGSIGQVVARMPFSGDGAFDGNKRGLLFLLSMNADTQADHLHGLIAFDEELLRAKLIEEDDEGEPRGTGGIYWSVFQLVSFYYGFVYEGLFVDGDAQGQGVIFNLFDQKFRLRVSRSKGRWSIMD